MQGRKTIELRKWNTHFRGEFLIHASKKADEEAMKTFGFDNLSTGKIVGKATLVDVKKYFDEESHAFDKGKHLASSDWGKYGFILENVSRVSEVECNGKQGFWDYP